MKRGFLLLLLAIFSSIRILAISINDSIPSGNNFEKAAFRLWYPDYYKNISGIIVLVPGSNGDGRGLTDERFWQELAQKHGFALLGCYFTDYKHDDMNVETYANARGGSGIALMDAISHFAERPGLKELSDAPLILWGHSAGGQFNYEFVCWKPEKVIAFVVNKGGFYYTALAPKPARNVPGLFFTGENDLESRKNIVKGIFMMNRRVGALWCFAEEQGAGHEIGQTQNLAGRFFDEIIPLRIPKKTLVSEQASELNILSAESGLTGDTKAKNFVPYTSAPKGDLLTSWLPNKSFAEAWLDLIRKSGN
jgi:hypothetical protein